MLHLAMAGGLVAGLIVGMLAASGSGAFMAVAMAAAPLGRLFMNAIQMAVIPLVVAVVFSGVARLGSPRAMGRLAGVTVALYWSSLLVAIVIGMLVMRVGLTFAPDPPVTSAAADPVTELPGFVDFLVGLLPSNPFAAASSGALLPLIVFVALAAAATATLPAERRERLTGVADDLGDVMIRLVRWILVTAPVGVFGLAAPVTAELGWDLVQGLAVFVASAIVAQLLYMALVVLPLLWAVAGIGPVRFVTGTFGAASVAFSTTSTAVALPVSLKESIDNLGISPAVADVLVPLGASMYRPGSALFQGAAIVYLAHLYSVPIPPAALGGALLASFLVVLTVAPVPSSSVVTLAPALDALGIPVAGIAVLLGVDRIPDMFRTVTNALSQISVAALVDRWLGGGRGPHGRASHGRASHGRLSRGRAPG